MADKVRSLIESMIWELKGLEKRNQFNEEEIRDIIKKRETLEYSMNKNTATVLEYQKAIQYEMELETLRKERFKELEIKRIKESDYHIIRRILFLFDRVCYKFKYNAEIWKQNLKFCIQIKSSKNFFRNLSKCLKFNANNLELWKIGVYYEFEINKNPFKSRQLFLRAIKSNGKEPSFWLAYLEFEAKFVKLVEKREKFLNENSENAKPSKTNFQDDFMGFEEENEEEENMNFLDNESDEEDINEEKLDENYSKSTSDLIVVIYESIVDALGKNVKIDEKVFEVLYKEAKDSKQIQKAIKDIEKKSLKVINDDGDDLETGIADTFNFKLGKLKLESEEIDIEIEQNIDNQLSKLDSFFISNQDKSKEFILLDILQNFNIRTNSKFTKNQQKSIKLLINNIIESYISKNYKELIEKSSEYHNMNKVYNDGYSQLLSLIFKLEKQNLLTIQKKLLLNFINFWRRVN